jgi:hypothetical protein
MLLIVKLRQLKKVEELHHAKKIKTVQVDSNANKNSVYVNQISPQHLPQRKYVLLTKRNV